MLTNTNFTTGYTAIPNVLAPDVASRVNAHIEFHMWGFFDEFFGVELSQKIQDLNETEQAVILDKAESALTYYIYAKWLEQDKTLTDIGSVKEQSSTGVKGMDVQRYAYCYNKAVYLSKTFGDWLKTQTGFETANSLGTILLPFINY